MKEEQNLREEIKNLQDSNKAANIKATNLEEEKTTWLAGKDVLDHERTRLQEAKSSYSKFYEAAIELEKAHTELETETSRLQGELDEYKSQEDTFNENQMMVSALQKEIKKLEEQEDWFNEQIDLCKRKVLELTNEHGKCPGEMENLRKEIGMMVKQDVFDQLRKEHNLCSEKVSRETYEKLEKAF